MDEMIYTMVRAADWRQAEALGEYRGSADDRRDGFLHFSAAAQLRASAAKHRAGEADLLLVAVAAAALGAALRWEPAQGGTKGGTRPGLFPHCTARCRWRRWPASCRCRSARTGGMASRRGSPEGGAGREHGPPGRVNSYQNDFHTVLINQSRMLPLPNH